MKNKTTRRVTLLFLAAGATTVLIACGGGQSASDGREQPSGLSAGSAIAWAPSAIAFSLNPGARQDIPVTFTTSVSLSNVAVTVVPELRNIVSVTPNSIATLSAGQSVTVTLAVAAGASEALRVVEGTIRLTAGSSTISKPLPVSFTIVSPQIINGVPVPPEPPSELNNVTLAGFDTNANGVRDDIDRLIATNFGGQPDAQYATAFAREYQATLIGPTPADRTTALVQVGRRSCAVRGATDSMRDFGWRERIANTAMRRQALRAFDDVLIGYLGRELPPCAN